MENSKLCGRFTLRSPAADWCQLLLPDLLPQELPFEDPPRFNIAPTQQIACVVRSATGEPRNAIKARWGLIPPWAEEASIGNRMINARGETVDTKASFKKPLATQRCLIPADGYYEWLKTADGKQPYLMAAEGSQPFAMAGLWERNRRTSEDGTPVVSCTIITTCSNQTTSHLHDRMPVILAPRDHDRWLDPGFRDVDALKSLLVPAPEELLQIKPVSRYVNNARHDSPKCVEPVSSHTDL